MPAHDREKALDMALAQIDKNFGKGSVMRLGDETRAPINVIPTGSIALDVALGIGGLPRGRVVEIYGPESSGKCLTAGTYVWTEHGLETLAELFARAGLALTCTAQVSDVRQLGLRALNERGELEQVAALTHNGRRPVLRLRLASGRLVEATRNHPLRVVDDQGTVVWRPAGSIVVGDTVVSAAFGAVEAAAGDGLTEDEAELLGGLLARPSLADRARVRLSAGDPEAVAEVTALLDRLFPGHDRPAPLADGDGLTLAGAEVRHLLHEQYGLAYVDGDSVAVPHVVRTAGHKAQRAFLSALFAGGATGEVPRATASLTTASERLARQVQLLLLGLGIASTLRGPGTPRGAASGWLLAVDPEALHRFGQEVGSWSARRRPGDDSLWRCAVDPVGVRSDRCLDEQVVAVEEAGLQPTFDVMLPRTHSFLANGVLSHNTTVALHAVASAQANGGIAAFIDAEHALDPEYAKKLGVDTDALLVSQPDTGEQALEIADMLVRSGALDVIVIDSVAALVPRAEIEGEMGDSHVGLQARLMSQALRKMTGALNSSGTTAIFINQLREKIGVMFGSPETTTGGKALKFYASVRIDVRRIETLKDGTEAVGNRTRAKIVKNKMAPPFKQAEFDIVYGVGISREGGLIDMGVEHGFIRKSGAWYTYEGDQLGQGKENARAFLRDNPDLADELEKRIKEKLGVGPVIDADPDLVAPVPVDL